jgi:PQQ-dependent dehydrogenase (methanol/ethanol family)
MRFAFPLVMLVVAGPLAGQVTPAPASPRTGLAGEWPTASLNPEGTRHSLLDQITPLNVDQLREAWRFETEIAGSWEGSPLVVGTVMYLHTPFPNHVIALDLTEPGRVLWRYRPPVDRNPPPTAARGTSVRGLAWHSSGLILAPILHGDLAALDARTGREVWRVRNADQRLGATVSSAPVVVDDVVLIGMAGSEYGVRGYLTAYRATTGQLLWRGYTTGPDAEVLVSGPANPQYPSHASRELGQSTWPPNLWQHGGGSTDGWLTWDPALRLVYYGTGAPAPWNATLRPGDNKWTSAIIARDLTTGQVRWAFQATPGDAWGYGAEGENILADLTIGGRLVRALVHFNRNGFAYTIDRTTGRLLVAERAGPANWVTLVNAATGLVTREPRYLPAPAALTRGICPATVGLKGPAPAAFNPATGVAFAPLANLCMDVQSGVPRFTPGEPYLGATWRIVPGPGVSRGRLVAWDPAQGAIRWEIGDPYPLLGGVLSTGSGLVFFTTADGWLKAVDQQNGREQWRYRLPSGSLGSPMTFLGPDGRQYLAVMLGTGGWAAEPNAAEVTRGLGWTGREPGVLVVFALPAQGN